MSQLFNHNHEWTGMQGNSRDESVIREHQLDRDNALPVLLAPFWRIEPLLHPHRVRLGCRVVTPTKERDGADHRCLRLA